MTENQNKQAFIVFLLLITVLVISIVNLPQNESEKKVVSKILESLAGEKVYSQEKELFGYVEIVDGCGPSFEGGCVNVRKEPNVNSGVVTRLRNGIVLKVSEKSEVNGEAWYRVTFKDEWLRYQERVSDDWYVSVDYVKSFQDEGPIELLDDFVSTSTKHIIVDRSDQKLYAYDGESLFFETSVSTGLDVSPTPRGIFHIYKKTPSRYMQGPIPDISEKEYDLPGVPWNLYFTKEGAVIHGAYWHDKFGQQWSSGCVNLTPENAKKLYVWADLGTEVLVRD
ncbi:L,D-transpeptidase family protein [Candidatus Gracilibacteria bacterium]|nr:L,D-transpeptidase family protein [Candidatus Gracilibacteria bacterium]